MLRKSIAFLGTLIALFLLLGLQSRSTAQISTDSISLTASVFSNSWATSDDATTTFAVHASVYYDDSGNLTGTIGCADVNFTSRGLASSIVTSEDADGNYTATITGTISYYPRINGKVQRRLRQVVTATVVFSEFADGTYSEGVTLVDLDGNVLVTTGTNDDGSITQWSLTNGDISVSL